MSWRFRPLKDRMQIRTGNLVAAALTATALSLHAATPTRVMLLDGANNQEGSRRLFTAGRRGRLSGRPAPPGS
jgi:hypothetical protein